MGNVGQIEISTPAAKSIRASCVLTALALAPAVVLAVLPNALMLGVDWWFFWIFIALAGGAIILALVASFVRGADGRAGTAMLLVGLNLVMILSVVIALFHFRAFGR
jgi:hypothetical protein